MIQKWTLIFNINILNECSVSILLKTVGDIQQIYFWKQKNNVVNFFMLCFNLLVTSIGKLLEYKIVIYNCLFDTFFCATSTVQQCNWTATQANYCFALLCLPVGYHMVYSPAVKWILSTALDGFRHFIGKPKSGNPQLKAAELLEKLPRVWDATKRVIIHLCIPEQIPLKALFWYNKLLG